MYHNIHRVNYVFSPLTFLFLCDRSKGCCKAAKGVDNAEGGGLLKQLVLTEELQRERQGVVAKL